MDIIVLAEQVAEEAGWLADVGNWFAGLWSIIIQMAGGIGVSLMIFVLTLVISLPLGMVVAFGRMSKFKVVSGITKAYISIMRGTPLMLQLMVLFFAPSLVFGIGLSASYRYVAVIIGFGINYAAYFAEIYRGGIESIPVGQYEAAFILGYSKRQTFMKIILPQVIKRIIPSVTNEVITLVKDTSLAYVISVAEMFTIAKQIVSAKGTLLPFLVSAVFYYVFNAFVAWVMEKLEKRYAYYTIK